MNVTTCLNLAGAVGTAAMGGLGLLAPTACARLVGLKDRNPTGFAEFRATYGGVFLALGLAPLVVGGPAPFLVSGLAWLAAAAGRVVSIVADKGWAPANLRAVAFELTFAGLLLVGAPVPPPE